MCPAPVKVRLNWQRFSEVDKSTNLILLRTDIARQKLCSEGFHIFQQSSCSATSFVGFLFYLFVATVWRWVSSLAPLRRTQFNLSLKQSSWYQIGWWLWWSAKCMQLTTHVKKQIQNQMVSCIANIVYTNIQLSFEENNGRSEPVKHLDHAILRSQTWAATSCITSTIRALCAWFL